MRRHITLLIAFLLGSVLHAQNLSNPDFESPWSSGAPPNWAVKTSGLTTTQDATHTHAGSFACKVQSTSTATQHFAKEWVVNSGSAIQVGDVVMAKLRIWYPTGQASASIYARATGVDNTAQKNDVGMQTQILLTPFDGWQEQLVAYRIDTLPASGLTIRVGLRFVNATSGVRLWLDHVYFQGSSLGFGTLVDPVLSEPDYQIASNGLRLVLHPYTGAIKAFEDTVLGVSYAPTLPTSSPLFLLETDPNEQPSSAIGTNEFNYSIIRPPYGTVASWTVQSATKKSTAPAEASKIRVTVDISPSATSSDLAFDVQTVDTNTSGRVYDVLTCPVVKLAPQLGTSAADDTVFVPGGDGWTVRGSGVFELNSSGGPWWHVRDYPGNASMQFAAYFDGTRGLAIEARDATGECKQIGYVARQNATDNNVELVLRRRYPYALGQTIDSYPVVLSRCSGGWESAAKHYRAWARQQPWAAAKYLGSPAWVRQRHPLYDADLEVMGNLEYLVQPDRWRAVMDAWALALDVPSTPALDVHMTPLFRNFEHNGIYASPYYTPLYPSDAIASSSWADVAAGGHHSMAMVAGLKWLKSRDTFPDASYPKANGNAYWVRGFNGCDCDNDPCAPKKGGQCYTDGCIVDGLGNTIDAWFDRYDGVNPTAPEVCVVDLGGCVRMQGPVSSWDGVKGWMCPGHSFAAPANCFPRTILANLASHLAARDIHLFELDQMNGGGSPPCYSTVHGHPRGYGKWIYERIAAILQAVRDVRQGGAEPDFAMTLEDPGELYLPYLDCTFGRPHHVAEWPADAVSTALVVPAFEYVYSDLAPAMTADLMIGARKQNGSDDTYNETHAIVELSRLYVAGGWSYFEIAPWMAYADWKSNPGGWEPLPSRANSKHLAYLQRTIATNVAVAGAYFDAARMVSADGFASPTFTYDELVNSNPVPHTVDSVSRSAWKLDAAGCTALVLANANPTVSSTTVTLPSGFDASSYVGAPYRVWRNGVRAPTDDGTLGSATSFTLAALEIAVLVFGGC